MDGVVDVTESLYSMVYDWLTPNKYDSMIPCSKTTYYNISNVIFFKKNRNVHDVDTAISNISSTAKSSHPSPILHYITPTNKTKQKITTHYVDISTYVCHVSCQHTCNITYFPFFTTTLNEVVSLVYQFYTFIAE